MKLHQLIESQISILSKSQDVHNLIIVSQGGLGKTTTLLKTLKARGLQEGHNYYYKTAHFTPLGFFQSLEETNNLATPKLLILDDTEGLSNNKIVISFLKSATWASYNDERLVCYNSSRKSDNKTLSFKGKMIMLFNEMPSGKIWGQAFIDRSLVLELKPTQQEIFETIRKEILHKPYKNLDYSRRNRVFQFIVKNSNSTSIISFRTLIKAFNNIMYCPQHWQELTLQLLGNKSETSQAVKHNQLL